METEEEGARKTAPLFSPTKRVEQDHRVMRETMDTMTQLTRQHHSHSPSGVLEAPKRRLSTLSVARNIGQEEKKKSGHVVSTITGLFSSG